MPASNTAPRGRTLLDTFVPRVKGIVESANRAAEDSVAGMASISERFLTQVSARMEPVVESGKKLTEAAVHDMEDFGKHIEQQHDFKQWEVGTQQRFPETMAAVKQNGEWVEQLAPLTAMGLVPNAEGETPIVPRIKGIAESANSLAEGSVAAMASISERLVKQVSTRMEPVVESGKKLTESVAYDMDDFGKHIEQQHDFKQWEVGTQQRFPETLAAVRQNGEWVEQCAPLTAMGLVPTAGEEAPIVPRIKGVAESANSFAEDSVAGIASISERLLKQVYARVAPVVETGRELTESAVQNMDAFGKHIEQQHDFKQWEVGTQQRFPETMAAVKQMAIGLVPKAEKETTMAPRIKRVVDEASGKAGPRKHQLSIRKHHVKQQKRQHREVIARNRAASAKSRSEIGTTCIPPTVVEECDEKNNEPSGAGALS